jgi:hypothetical protein
MSVLWRGERTLVRSHVTPGAGPVVITFDPWSPAPSLDGTFFGEDFLTSRGFAAIGVKTARNDWYQHDEMDAVLAAIRSAAAGRRRVGYGGSMGAYALLNWADVLELDDIIAVVPQCSPDPARAPFETRWQAEWARLTPSRDRMASAARPARGHIVFDPFTVDARHAAAILAHHELTPVRLGFCGHLPLLSLHHAGLLEPMLQAMLTGTFGHSNFIRRWRRQRRRDEAYWLYLSRALLRRGQRSLAEAAAKQAVRHARTDPFAARLQLADATIGAKTMEASLAALVPLAKTPEQQEIIRWRAWEWSKLYGPLRDPSILPPPRPVR